MAQITLGIGDDSYFTINGLPYQRGSITPLYEAELVKMNDREDYTDKVALRRTWATRNDLYGTLLYSDYIDASTGNPFASYNDLIQWIAENVFEGTISAGGPSGITFTRQFNIVAGAPASSNEKTEGDTFTDAWLVGKTVTVLMINGVAYTGAQIDHDSVAGEIGPTGSSFVAGDVVIIFTA